MKTGTVSSSETLIAITTTDDATCSWSPLWPTEYTRDSDYVRARVEANLWTHATEICAADVRIWIPTCSQRALTLDLASRRPLRYWSRWPFLNTRERERKKKAKFVISKVHFPRADILLNLWFILYIFIHSNIDMIKTFPLPSPVHSPSHKKSRHKKKAWLNGMNIWCKYEASLYHWNSVLWNERRGKLKLGLVC